MAPGFVKHESCHGINQSSNANISFVRYTRHVDSSLLHFLCNTIGEWIDRSRVEYMAKHAGRTPFSTPP